MQKNYRSGRLGEEIRRIISDLMRKELKDPRIDTLTSVTAVEVTSDNSYATVYLSVLGDEEKKRETLEAFKRAGGFIRNHIGRSIKIKHVPELVFKIDTSLDYGMHISKLIDELHGDERHVTDEGEEDETK